MQNYPKSITLIVPTLNPGKTWHDWCARVEEQNLQGLQIVQIDSASEQKFENSFSSQNYLLHVIDRADFNHGGTRNLAVSFVPEECKILIFMTHDALLNEPTSIENLVKPFSDPQVAAVCGRQIPHDGANPIASHARYFNYPSQSSIKSLADKSVFGIKTAFMSNSFAAYRLSVFKELGGFPENTIFSEDMYLTAKMLLAGYKIAYAGDAVVKHSHNYSVCEEFKRYFDIGVFHAMEPWIMETFGKAAGEGKRFVLSEMKYLLKNSPIFLPKAFMQTFAKLAGYKLGLNYKKLSINLCKRLSMTKSFWK